MDDRVRKLHVGFRNCGRLGIWRTKVDKRDGSRGEQLLAFDPNEEEILMSPPLQGG